MASQNVSDPYNYADFWRNPPEGAYGPWQAHDPQASPEHQLQEVDLYEVITHLRPNHRKVPIGSILEVGCGQGRLTKFFAEHFPEAAYEAIDLSADALMTASRYRPDGTFNVADIVTYDAEARYEDPDFGGFDLVIASEVLMHIPSTNGALERAVENLLILTNADRGHLVTIDWVPTPEELNKLRRRRGGIAPWNFPHNYRKLFSTFGSLVREAHTSRQVIYVTRP